MPLHFARRLVGRERTREADRTLGFLLAAVAGAMNAGGFLAVRQYTSHMTGIVSSMADQLALGDLALVADGLAAVASFVLGSATSAVMVNFARRRRLASEYALPLLLEGLLILCFGLLGAQLAGLEALVVPATVVLLCYMMGLQNAVVTKLSNAVIRTTHVTGIVTDFGIELGKLLYRNDPTSTLPPVCADRDRLRVLATLLGCFFAGGVAGALGFKWVGYSFTVPIALALAVAAVVPFWDDLRGGASWRKH